MFKPFEWILALRYMRARRQEGFISVVALFSLLGIGLGVATLIIVMAVMNGFRIELMGRILGINGHVIVQAQAGPLNDYEALAKRIEGLAGVASAMPIVEGQVMATAQGQSSGALVRGIAKTDVARVPLVAGTLQGATLDAFDGADAVFLGERLANKLGVWVGDKVVLISPQGTQTAFGTTPRLKAYTVAAVFKLGMAEYDATFIFMPLDNARAFFRTGTGVSAIEVMLNNPDTAGAAVGRIAPLAGAGARLVTWEQLNATFFGALEVERNVMFLILVLIILIAAFNIISSLIMLVKDKGRGIAILRTMGATRGAVMRIFLIVGSAIGVVGTGFGVVLGVVFCANIESIRQALQNLTGAKLFPDEIYFLSQIPAKMEVGETVLVVVIALALSFLATLYPSWRAARLDPVEALRYE